MKFKKRHLTQLLGGSRRCGKTTKLVKVSANENKIILCKNMQRRKVIEEIACSLGLKIPTPVTIHEHMMYKKRFIDNNLLVDDVEDILESILGCKIDYMTTSCKLRK